jgi:uncharacterized delta-60 repeat protein
MKTGGLFRITYVLLILFAASAISHAQGCIPASTAAGALDTCFDTDGKVTTQVSSGIDIGRAVAVQPDGKIIVAGIANFDTFGTAIVPYFAVIRYNTDGSLDTTFANAGIASTTFDNFDAEAKAVQIQSDGKIVVAGSISMIDNADFALVRYNQNGSLDTSFGDAGKVRLIDVDTASFDYGKALLIQPDGKLIVVGDRRVGTGTAFTYVARFNTNGSLDTTFDTDGRASFFSMNATNAARLQSDGKIVLAGSAGVNLAVARMNADGSIDTSFGGAINVATFTAASRYDEAYAVAIEANGKIIAAGVSQVSQTGAVCAPIVRFSISGTLENSFVNCNETPGGMVINGIVIQPDGKILTAGIGGLDSSHAFQIVRYTTALAVDTTFNGSGIVRVGFNAGNNNESPAAYAITLQRDNRIVAVGTTKPTAGGTTGQIAVVRVMSGLAASHAAMFDYDADGKADVSVFRPSNNVWYQFKSSNSQVTEQEFGLAGDIAAPADYDGDGKFDIGIFRPATGDWWFKSSITGVFNNFHWGKSGDVPRPSDFDGDGKADYVVYRPTENNWYRWGSTAGFSFVTFGASGDKPQIGDFDADGKTDAAIYRPSTGTWWWKSTVNSVQHATQWGISTDLPAPADFDGDGKTDFAVYRASTGTWYIYNSADNSSTIVNFGIAEDKPVAADYDGDGRADIAVFRPSTGTWYLLRSTAGFTSLQFGNSTDIPTPNAFVQ